MTSIRPLTKDALRVLFEGEERPGVSFYAYWQGVPQIEQEPEFPLKVWPTGSRVKHHRLFGESWTVLNWDLAVKDWPPRAAWPKLLRQTLKTFTKAGARIAWCGLEGFFADPPSLFSPREMSGGVYAALTTELGFLCSSLLDQPLEPLSDEVLLKLRAML